MHARRRETAAKALRFVLRRYFFDGYLLLPLENASRRASLGPSSDLAAARLFPSLFAKSQPEGGERERKRERERERGLLEGDTRRHSSPLFSKRGKENLSNCLHIRKK